MSYKVQGFITIMIIRIYSKQMDILMNTLIQQLLIITSTPIYFVIHREQEA